MTPSASKSAGRGCILLVDDNHHGLIARKAVLEELGYRITTAVDGEEALDRLAVTHFDIVVTDYRMPKLSGVELIQRIREKEPATQVILLSGFVEPLGLTEETTGADVVIAKSAGEVRTLLRSVDKLVSRRIPRKPAVSQRGTAARPKARTR